jgi:hypothetical protein
MSRKWLAPPGTPRRIQMSLLVAVAIAPIGVLGAYTASRFGLDALLSGEVSAAVAALVLLAIPVRLSAEVSEVFPGGAEPLFQLATDPTLSLQITGNPDRRRLLRQTGEPGQPGSTWVTEGSGMVVTSRVVSSDPPRKLVLTITSQFGLQRIDVTRIYVTVPGGTRLEMTTRHRMPLFSWLLRPVFQRELQAQVVQMNARISDYLASVTANASGAGK